MRVRVPAMTREEAAAIALEVARPRTIKQIAAWINANLPELEARTERGHCNTDTKIPGTRLRRQGKGRWGTRIKVYRRGAKPHGIARLILDHNNAETYRTTADVERWLHNYRFCCKAGRHWSTFGSGSPCSTCGAPFKRPKKARR